MNPNLKVTVIGNNISNPNNKLTVTVNGNDVTGSVNNIPSNSKLTATLAGNRVIGQFSDLDDTRIQNPRDNDVIRFDESTFAWINDTIEIDGGEY